MTVVASPDILIALMEPSIEEVSRTRSWIAAFYFCWSCPIESAMAPCPKLHTVGINLVIIALVPS